MPITIGIDLGTTTLTALAVDLDGGAVLARRTRPTAAETTATADKARGFAEWDADQVTAVAVECLRDVVAGLQGREVVGIGITGQQHGTLLIDRTGRAISPLVNWQDRRALEPFPGTTHSYIQEAVRRVGDGAARRCGCRLSTGYLATTLFWYSQRGELPADATAIFLSDYLAARLTGERPATDPTFAASAGVFDVADGQWDAEAIAALGLPIAAFPDVWPCGTRLGGVRLADVGLHDGTPVFVAMGDNQASVLGSLAEPDRSVLVNVGTGGQVSAVVRSFAAVPGLETRPFPGGYLLASVGLAGGRAYAALEQFFRRVGQEVFGRLDDESAYAAMNRLAAAAPPGCDGLTCEPAFGGTRAEPARRGAWTGLSFENFTPGHFARSLLEGSASAYRSGFDLMRPHQETDRDVLIGSGNGIRENPLLAELIAHEFGLRLRVPAHREEAAFGAALVAGVGSEVIGSWSEVGRAIRYSAGNDRPGTEPTSQ